MAADLTIDDYLDGLRRRLRQHHARDDILFEVEDHLRTTAERLADAGTAHDAAEAEAVRMFGDPEVVAEALLAANGKPAVPTTYTVGIGTTTVVGSLLWLGLAAAFWGSRWAESDGAEWEGIPSLLFMLGAASLLGAGVVTLLLMSALRIRVGGFGKVALAGMGVTVLATAASFIAWAVQVWATLFALGCLPVAVALLRQGAAPRIHAWGLALAWPIGLGTLVALRLLEYGEVDEWGDYPAAYLTGMTVGCALMTVALVGLGRWLRSETPVDSHPGVAVA